MSQIGNYVDDKMYADLEWLPSYTTKIYFGDPDRWQRWLDACRQRQIELFGIDPCELEGEELAQYIQWTVLALLDEIHEILRTVQWKPWATEDKGEVDWDHALEELADAMFFLGNLACALNITHEQLFSQLEIKDEIVRMRANGYNPRLEHHFRELFIADRGLGPWECYFCHQVVTKATLHVHHKDHNHDNVDPDNLLPTHGQCHGKYHATVARARPEERQESTCEFCDRIFATQPALNAHLRHKHGQGKPNQGPYNVDRVQKTCPDCGTICAGSRSLNTHRRMAHQQIEVTCTACDKVFKSKTGADAHRRMHEIQIIVCELCNKECKGIGAYKKHQTESHNPKIILSCSECGKNFVGERGLKIHIHRMHKKGR